MTDNYKAGNNRVSKTTAGLPKAGCFLFIVNRLDQFAFLEGRKILIARFLV